MARGSSQSQTSSSAGGAGRPMTVGARGTPAAAAGMRRRRLGGGGGGSAGGGFGGGAAGSNMLRFYTDDAPGLKMTPTVVLVMSLCFIGFVTALHVFGKLYRYRSSATGGS
ncbi:protein transport protein Sec61 subunit beta [Cocos nucifera]|uniref:Protein transport protein Sec61 subunit beta n=1 Tax=Cocos nucifera TaxID=13894 RepID=A0A8K0IRY9_COCNU|nr:protein transport protein Sec61 subunit beta [Cocos nucifera]